jgi:hypothetical protein
MIIFYFKNSLFRPKYFSGKKTNSFQRLICKENEKQQKTAIATFRNLRLCSSKRWSGELQ